MSIYRIKMNGKTYEMEIELLEEGKPKKGQKAQEIKETVITKQKSISTQNKAEKFLNSVTAPMPGNVVEIMVSKGDEVKENDVILILEAMKMENEIITSKAGKVKNIFVNKGQTVATGDPLFELED